MNNQDAYQIMSSNKYYIEQLIVQYERSLSDPLVVQLSQEMDKAVLHLQLQMNK